MQRGRVTRSLGQRGDTTPGTPHPRSAATLYPYYPPEKFFPAKIFLVGIDSACHHVAMTPKTQQAETGHPMTSHQFAHQLLAGPDLPIVVPKVTSYEEDPENNSAPPLVTEVEGGSPDEGTFPIPILLISYAP